MTLESSRDLQLQQRDFLLRLARAMSARLDLSEVLEMVVHFAVELTHGHAGVIALRQGEGPMEIVASYRLHPSLHLHLQPLLDAVPDALPSSWGGRQAGPMQEALRRLAVPLPNGFSQLIALPLMQQERLDGMLFVFRSEGAALFTPLDQQMLSAFADQAAVAIQNAFLVERLAARERHLSAVVEHNPAGMLLLDEAGYVRLGNPPVARLAGTEVVGSHLYDLLRLEDERGEAVPLPLPDGAEGSSVQGFLRQDEGGRGPFVQISITPLPGPSGADGFVVNLVDLTVLKEAERAKHTFLAGLSHELKTPLALIRGYAETLRMPQARTDEALYSEALDVILEETTHLTEMVNQLLQAARLQVKELPLEQDEVALDVLLRKLIDAFQQAHPAHQWRLTLPEQVPPLLADPTRLRELFHNLFANAARYSDPGTPIEVSLEVTPGSLTIRVRDEGIGIAPADQPHLFQRFFRASERGEGTGLGLYMSKAIVEAHSGTITVESQPGRGSVFTVTLPQRAGEGERRGQSGVGRPGESNRGNR